MAALEVEVSVLTRGSRHSATVFESGSELAGARKPNPAGAATSKNTTSLRRPIVGTIVILAILAFCIAFWWKVVSLLIEAPGYLFGF